MEKWSESIKKLVSKKYVANILVVIAIAVMALIVSGDFLFKDTITKKNTNDSIGDQLVRQTNLLKTEEEMIEERLKKILENIKGAGKVEVMITFEIGSEIIPALNTVESTETTEEKDSNGGTRIVTSQNKNNSTVVTNDTTGNKPVVIKEIKPQVKGVIVAAEGAENIEVKAKLYEAVKTVLQIPGHRVQVYPKN